MNIRTLFFIAMLWAIATGCSRPTTTAQEEISNGDTVAFPDNLVEFVPYDKNPVFTGTGTATWDEKIRERGFILHEDSAYYMWYTGYTDGEDPEMHLGYATSADGLVWTRYKNNPVYDSGWVEDVMVVKSNGTYFMFAEGKGDIAHLLSSLDRIHWREEGSLDIRYTNGTPLSAGAYGTPAAWLEDGVWYLFYERGDLGIWLATSTDMKVWTNKQDEPVIALGPDGYDAFGVAVNQIIKYNGRYYAYYHATDDKEWTTWTSNVAMSEDLVHWKKYPHNPIARENKSSPILVHDGTDYRLYTMHESVNVHFPRKQKDSLN